MSLRSSAALVLVALLVAPLPATPAAPSGVPAPLVVARAPLRDELAQLAEEIAASGRCDEAETVQLALAALGHPAGELAALAQRCTPEETARAARFLPLPRAAAALQRIATSLNRELAQVDPARRVALARWIVRLDAAQPLAQRVLGRELRGERFVDPQEERCSARRRALEAAVAAARELPIELAARPFDDGTLTLTTFGQRAAGSLPFLRYGRLEFVGTLPRAQLERLVRGALRASALSEFARGRPLAVPEALHGARGRLVLLDSTAAYRAAIDEAAASGGLSAGAAEAARFHCGFGSWFEDARGHCVMNAASERSTASTLLLWLSEKWLSDRLQPTLLAGHLNWLSLRCFGTRTAELVSQASDPASGAPAPARRLLEAQVERGAEAGWGATFVDSLASLRPLLLPVATARVEWLQERGELEEWLQRTARGDDDLRNCRERMVDELPEPLERLEARFEAWLLKERGGVAQRLTVRDARAAERLAKHEATLVAELETLRRAAFADTAFASAPRLFFDRAAAQGCVAHAFFLQRHPERLLQWPQMHEQLAHEEGYSEAGAWAGSHAVIAPGTSSASVALERWMASCYHRLPLLDPGLRGIAVGSEGGIAVVDCASFVEPTERDGLVVWPPRDGRDVPRRFWPELPHPAPGLDLQRAGYPITVQWYGRPLDVALRLWRGRAGSGEEVECRFSSPKAPLNDDLVPGNACFLIPCEPLAAGTLYTVEAERVDGTRFDWSFTTER